MLTEGASTIRSHLFLFVYVDVIDSQLVRKTIDHRYTNSLLCGVYLCCPFLICSSLPKRMIWLHLTFSLGMSEHNNNNRYESRKENISLFQVILQFFFKVDPLCTMGLCRPLAEVQTYQLRIRNLVFHRASKSLVNSINKNKIL